MSASSERILGRKGVNPLKYDRQFRGASIPMTPARRKLIAKVKIAQADLRLDDDTYRAILLEETGETSSTTATDAKLVQLLKRFESRGWKPKPAQGEKRAARPADHPSANKARALMISLHHLGVIESAAESALEAFAARQLKCDRLQWANQSQCFLLIEALKAMADRAGWDQSLLGVKRDAHVITLKRRLVVRQLALLVQARVALPDWSVEAAARELGDVAIDALPLAGPGELDSIAQAFGRAIWAAKQAGALE